MTTLLHLSDLHLTATPERVAKGTMVPQYRQRIGAIGRGIKHWLEGPDREPVSGILLTGDILDSSTIERDDVDRIAKALFHGLRALVGAAVPIFAIPGNHDRRYLGLVRAADHVVPHLSGLGRGPAGAVAVRDLWFRTADDPLALLQLPSIGYPIALYDSTYLGGGLVSAGGTVRAEDVISLDPPLRKLGHEVPLIFALHHHLVPTAVTDLEDAGAGRGTGVGRWVMRQGLRIARAILSNADKEETTMTALGAGSMLTALHSLGRPVIVLHGHKHYPTVRLLRGTRADEGDVALVAAGSAGVAEEYRYGERPMHIWPSLNAIRLDQDGTKHRLAVDTIVFAPPGRKRKVLVRPALRAETIGARWQTEDIDDVPEAATLAVNRAKFRVVDASQALDLHATRELEFMKGAAAAVLGEPMKYVEPVDGLPTAALSVEGPRSRVKGSQTSPALEIDIANDCGKAVYVLHNALASTREQARRSYGEETWHEWVGLLNRYPTARAEMTVVFPGEALSASAFGSITDLSTGREVPCPIEREGSIVRLVAKGCGARTILRLRWRLPRTADRAVWRKERG